jgi:hypothetical protein
MSQDPYRPPEAPLTKPGSPLGPRSAVVAVVLGWITALVTSLAIGLMLQVRGIPVDSGGSGLALAGVTGLLAGWIAARYRRGPWLGVALALIALDLGVTLPMVAIGSVAATALLQFSLSAAGDVLGGYLGRGSRARVGIR